MDPNNTNKDPEREKILADIAAISDNIGTLHEAIAEYRNIPERADEVDLRYTLFIKKLEEIADTIEALPKKVEEYRKNGGEKPH